MTTNKTSNAAINLHKNKNFDFGSIANLASFWDGGANASGFGGGQFNTNKGRAGIDGNLDHLYQSLVGRNADPGGRKYWGDLLESGGTTYQTVVDSLKADKEYTGQQSYLADNPDATADDLKNLDTAYVSPFHPLSGSGAAGYKPGDTLTQGIADAVSSNYSDQTNRTVDDVITSLNNGGTGINNSTMYDDSALRNMISGLTGQLGDLRSAFDAYKTQSASDMQNMWNNYNWGYGQTVGGVRTQNELPGWAPKRGGTSGFFGRGGRAGKGLTTSSLNI